MTQCACLPARYPWRWPKSQQIPAPKPTQIQPISIGHPSLASMAVHHHDAKSMEYEDKGKSKHNKQFQHLSWDGWWLGGPW